MVPFIPFHVIKKHTFLIQDHKAVIFYSIKGCMWQCGVRAFFFYHFVSPLRQITIIENAFVSWFLSSFKFSLSTYTSRSHISVCPALLFQVLQFTLAVGQQSCNGIFRYSSTSLVLVFSIKGPINRFSELCCFSRYSTSAGLVHFASIHQK